VTYLDPADQLTAEVLPTEMGALRARRRAVGLAAREAEADAPLDDLVGLALSGGGIRSATFSLGVVQALTRSGTLRLVDYLSTVSGGGYLGGCLSSLLADPAAGSERERCPLTFVEGQPEPASVRHLRNSGHYLAPNGILDRVRLPLLLVRGALVNALIFTPFIVLFALFTELVFELSHALLPGHLVDALVRQLPGVFLGTFVVAALVYPAAATVLGTRLTWQGRNRYDRTLGALLVAAVVALAAVPMFGLIGLMISSDPYDFLANARADSLQRFHPFAWHVAWIALLPIVALAGFAAAVRGSGPVAWITRRIGIAALGMLGPGILVAAYLLFCLYQIDSPMLDGALAPSLDRGEVSAELAAAMDRKALALGPDASVVVEAPGQAWRLIDPPEDYRILRSGPALRIDWRDLWTGEGEWQVLAYALLLFIGNRLLTNINTSSGNGFYRDRLSRAYIVRQAPDGGIAWNDGLRLSELRPEGASGPYHLINAALNLQGSNEPDLRGREVDFFLFSSSWVGSRRTGYCRTADMEAADPNLNLATAVAISGAAAAPNMGRMTMRSLTFGLTLLNVRLGYWVPNPRRITDILKARFVRMAYAVGPSLLFSEALGRLTAHGPYVNLSDGGHVENLGIYALLQRRCRVIIAVDAEADVALRFASLIQLIRYARIDLGVEIDLDVDALRAAGDGHSGAHMAIGHIRYGEGSTGTLIYLKATVTGDEPLDVLAYRAGRPAFPHESTAEQFFSEPQFEAYRALGYHIARQVFRRAEGATDAATLVAAIQHPQENTG